jgi:peptidoglycan-N-acetylglucosamine deacetylase
MIHRTPFFLPMLYPTLTWRMPAGKQEIFLTFDDGPVPGPTEFVIDTLKRYNAKATFFCIGENIKKHPQIFKSIISNGHAIGNHTFNHVNGWKTSIVDYCSNVEQCANEIKFHTVQNSNAQGTDGLFRPPYGRIARGQIKALHAYKIIMWDVLSIDYDNNLKPEECLKKTVNATRAGSIIVFHDSYKAEKNLIFALPKFIEHFLIRGFSFKSIEI